MEQEFIQNQQRLKPQVHHDQKKKQVNKMQKPIFMTQFSFSVFVSLARVPSGWQEEKNQEERTKVDELRGTPMTVGNLEEIIDDNHAIVSSAMGPE